MASPPQLSIVATVLNEASTIEALVTDLLAQTFPDFEIVVVDGGSSDGTWETLQRLAANEPRLRIIRDETCRLSASAGPIARGRNRAIAEASSAVVACGDAGCRYAADWAATLTEPILKDRVDYALGGSYIDPSQATIWDIAAAPFLGVKLSSKGRRKSCTTRSMALTKDLWRRVGKFPEVNLFGEDTLFDLRARELTTPVFPEGAMARYNPRFTFSGAARRLGLYATSDGVLGVRRMRLLRNLLRCIAQVAALIALCWTVIPAVIVLLLELFFAFEHEVRAAAGRRFLTAVPARVLFSTFAPWIVAYHHLNGAFTKKNPPNAQNARANLRL